VASRLSRCAIPILGFADYPAIHCNNIGPRRPGILSYCAEAPCCFLAVRIAVKNLLAPRAPLEMMATHRSAGQAACTGASSSGVVLFAVRTRDVASRRPRKKFETDRSPGRFLDLFHYFSRTTTAGEPSPYFLPPPHHETREPKG